MFVTITSMSNLQEYEKSLDKLVELRLISSKDENYSLSDENKEWSDMIAFLLEPFLTSYLSLLEFFFEVRYGFHTVF